MWRSLMAAALVLGFIPAAPVVGSAAAAEVSVGIIGAGIGGSATALFLREALAGQGVDAAVHVYEKTAASCGRVTSVTLPRTGLAPEAGGAILHRANKYMSQFAADLGLAQTRGGYEVGRCRRGTYR